jgi:hypothetical protein
MEEKEPKTEVADTEIPIENEQGTAQESDNAPQSDPISSFLENPKVNLYLGRAAKTMVFFAILGCIVILAAVTAISNLINQALTPHQ